MEYKFPKSVVLIGKAKEVVADFRDKPEKETRAFGCLNHLYQGIMSLRLEKD